MSSSRCRLCAADVDHAFDATDTNQHVSRERFAYGSCVRCGTLSLVEIPPDLGRYYPRSYYPPLPSPEEIDARAQAHRWRLDLLRAHLSSGRLIEIGASAGFFAHLANQAGYDVTAIEMDANCCRHLREVVGVEVIESDDPVAALGNVEATDAITLWHVLEHVERPGELLARVAGALAPGGVLVASLPNVDSLQFRLLGRRWPHVDAPRHLALIPLEALSQRAAELGLERVHVTAADPAGEYDAFGWQGLFPGHPSGRFGYLAGRAVDVLVTPIQRRGLNGSTYTAVFRKQ